MSVTARVLRTLLLDNEVKMFLKGTLVNGKLLTQFVLVSRTVSRKTCFGPWKSQYLKTRTACSCIGGSVVICKFSLKTAGNGVILFPNRAYGLAVLFDRMQKTATQTNKYVYKNKYKKIPTNLYISTKKVYISSPFWLLSRQCNFASRFKLSWAAVLPHSCLPQFCYISLAK